MKKVNRAISLIPITLFLLMVTYNLIFTHIDIDQKLYEVILFYGNEIVMAIMSVFLLLVCYRLKLCWYNKISVYGLLSLSVINIVALATGLNSFIYYNIIMISAMSIVGILALIFLIIKK